MLKKFLLFGSLIFAVVVVGQNPDNPNPDFPPTTQGTASQTCGQSVMDVVFVVDVSGSITLPNFNKMMDAIRNFVATLTIGSSNDQSHVGLTTFSSSATRIFGLDDHLTNQDLDQALSKVPYTEGGTNITSGMEEAISIFSGSGNRPDVPDVMVVITDGQDSSNVKLANQQATAKGISIFAIGVGSSNNLDLKQLAVVAGSSDNVFVSTNFTFLDTVLRGKVCEKIVETVQSLTTPIPNNPPHSQVIMLDEPPPQRQPPPQQESSPQRGPPPQSRQTTPSTEFQCEGINEVFDGCGGCEASCGNFTFTCIQNCELKNARCRCQNGFVRHSNGSCVLPDVCCDSSEVFDACGGCEETCGKKRFDCIDGCDFAHARCRCRRGMARNESGICIARDGCSASQSGQQCAINEILRCSTSCEGTCANRQPNCIFNAPNRRACRFQRCECPVENGFVRDHFGRCFQSSFCPQTLSGPVFSPQQQQNQLFESNEENQQPFGAGGSQNEMGGSQNPEFDDSNGQQQNFNPSRPNNFGQSGSNNQPSKTIIIIKPEFTVDDDDFSHHSSNGNNTGPQRTTERPRNFGSNGQNSNEFGNSGQGLSFDQPESNNMGGQGFDNMGGQNSGGIGGQSSSGMGGQGSGSMGSRNPGGVSGQSSGGMGGQTSGGMGAQNSDGMGGQNSGGMGGQNLGGMDGQSSSGMGGQNSDGIEGQSGFSSMSGQSQSGTMGEQNSGSMNGQGSNDQNQSNRPSKIIIFPNGKNNQLFDSASLNDEEERERKRVCRRVVCGSDFHCELDCIRGICQPSCVLNNQ